MLLVSYASISATESLLTDPSRRVGLPLHILYKAREATRATADREILVFGG
jgi:hypothetical protein